MGPVTKETALEAMSMDDNGVLGLRFSSIKQAENASVLFTKTARYRGCTVNFLPDPCAQPLVEGASPQLLASPRMRA